MANDQKKIPIHAKKTPPTAIVTLMQAFHVDSEETAQSLIMESARAIAFGDDENGSKSFQKVSKDAEMISSMMRGMKPKDPLEALYAAQIIVCHILGMRKMASTYPPNQKIGLKMLRFSNESIQNILKKRGAESQHLDIEMEQLEDLGNGT